ncbi:MAG: oxygen-dependent coproporphyrinogen oxidase [Flavobacteriaceae bacterium]|jgi:coproporphyrinogen III oxidase
MKSEFSAFIDNLQNEITSALEKVDGKATFIQDNWERPGGGGGQSRIIQNGAVFEKGGVNVSKVNGTLPDSMKAYLKVDHGSFFACGLSLVIHPKNPFVPTVHANYRYFELYDEQGEVVDQWFGGGQDLTPYYLFDDDAAHFHQESKTVCDRHDKTFYPKYKEQCDRYFWNTHRDEARGVGGLFFDYCRPNEKHSLQQWYDFVTDLGRSFLKGYLPIVEKRKKTPYKQPHRQWQELRRGRYVEFNLIHDKGTLFGLKTKGRIESILMSLPPVVQWHYNVKPTPESDEARLVSVLKKPVNWI